MQDKERIAESGRFTVGEMRVHESPVCGLIDHVRVTRPPNPLRLVTLRLDDPAVTALVVTLLGLPTIEKS
jgi:hypothetical protein